MEGKNLAQVAMRHEGEEGKFTLTAPMGAGIVVLGAGGLLIGFIIFWSIMGGEDMGSLIFQLFGTLLGGVIGAVIGGFLGRFISNMFPGSNDHP